MNISLIGMPGCGKSSIGKQAAKALGLKFLDTDEIIEQKYGSIPRLFKVGEEHFRKIETTVIKEAAAEKNAIISTGGGSILKEENMSRLKQAGKVVYICRPLEKIISDIDDTHRPLIKGKRDALVELYKQRKALYEEYADYTVLNNQSEDIAVNALIRFIKEVLK